MQMLEPVRMSGEDAGPVWARSRRRSRGAGPLVGFIVSLLAIFGAVVVIASVKEGSIAGGGAFVDHWVGRGVQASKDFWHEATSGTEKAADAVAEEAQPVAAAPAATPAPEAAQASAPPAKTAN